MNTENKKVLKHLAEPNLRGKSILDLVCEVQSLQEQKEMETEPEHKFYLECAITHIMREFVRRESLQYNGIQTTNSHIIETIKAKVDIRDVLEWYTEVFCHQNKWTFRCTVHGDDKHPSGVVYKDQNKWHCFGCNKGGDIFDAVCHFERVDMSAALRKLAKHIGLDLTLPKTALKTDIEERVENIEGKLEHIHTSLHHPDGKRKSKSYKFNCISSTGEGRGEGGGV